MLLSTLILTLGIVQGVQGLPTGKTLGHSEETRSAGRVDCGSAGLESRRELPIAETREVARLAGLANSAYCPIRSGGHIRPDTTSDMIDPEVNNHQVAFIPRTPPSGMKVLSSSADPEYEDLSSDLSMGWYIAHDHSTTTLTLAFSSLPSINETLELLASDPSGDKLVDLPTSLIAAPVFMEGDDEKEQAAPRIWHAYLPLLETQGTAAILALKEILNSPAPPSSTRREGVLATIMRSLSFAPTTVPSPYNRVEIVGHGMGAAVGLISAVALRSQLPHLDISATLFGLPRVGDKAFASIVEGMQASSGSHRSGALKIRQISAMLDPVLQLPPRHHGLVHPVMDELFVGDGTDGVYAGGQRAGDDVWEGVYSSSSDLGRMKLEDHAGPYAGVRIGDGRCDS